MSSHSPCMRNLQSKETYILHITYTLLSQTLVSTLAYAQRKAAPVITTSIVADVTWRRHIFSSRKSGHTSIPTPLPLPLSPILSLPRLRPRVWYFHLTCFCSRLCFRPCSSHLPRSYPHSSLRLCLYPFPHSYAAGFSAEVTLMALYRYPTTRFLNHHLINLRWEEIPPLTLRHHVYFQWEKISPLSLHHHVK